MAEIFISYSRKDQVFVQTLHVALEAANHDAWVDWQDIPLSADWWHEIQRGIEMAHTFIFIISPDSVISKVCRQEIDYSVKTNKRLIPILWREGFEIEQVHTAIARHNWVVCREQDDFDSAFQSLLKAINTDLDYVYAHTRLLVHALEWEDKARNDSFLLHGSDLQEAEQWLQQENKEPKPTEQQINYIIKSREAENAYQRLIQVGQKSKRMVQIGSAVLGVTICAAALVSAMTIRALEELQEAKTATRLERESATALQQFNSDQLNALLVAVHNGKALQALVKDNRPISQYPTISPLFALRTLLENIQEQNRLRVDQSNVSSAQFSPDGSKIVTVDDRGTIRLWTSTGQKLAEFKGHRGQVLDANFSPDGKTVATVGSDRTARLWSLSGKQLAEFKGHQGLIWSVSFSPDGQRLATASVDGTARLWSLSGEQLVEFKGHQGWVGYVRFSPNGQQLATVGGDRTARLWSLTGQQITVFRGHQASVSEVNFSPDGQTIVTAGDDGTARLWNLAGKTLAEFKGHLGAVLGVSFSPDGTRIATSGRDSTIRVWNLSGHQLLRLKAILWINSVNFSPDGQQLVTAGGDGTARLWNLSKPQITNFKASQGWIWSLNFSPDGTKLAVAGVDGVVRLWNLSGQQLAEFKGHQSSV